MFVESMISAFFHASVLDIFVRLPFAFIWPLSASSFISVTSLNRAIFNFSWLLLEEPIFLNSIEKKHCLWLFDSNTNVTVSRGAITESSRNLAISAGKTTVLIVWGNNQYTLQTVIFFRTASNFKKFEHRLQSQRCSLGKKAKSFCFQHAESVQQRILRTIGKDGKQDVLERWKMCLESPLTSLQLRRTMEIVCLCGQLCPNETLGVFQTNIDDINVD